MTSGGTFFAQLYILLEDGHHRPEECFGLIRLYMGFLDNFDITNEKTVLISDFCDLCPLSPFY